jgi:uncharacterized membrane protein
MSHQPMALMLWLDGMMMMMIQHIIIIITIIVTVFCTRGTHTKECHSQPTNSGFLTGKAQGLPL